MTEYASTSEAPSDRETLATLHRVCDAIGGDFDDEIALLATAHRLLQGARR
jgi:hypothetical protein